jgi:hypothetical protein
MKKAVSLGILGLALTLWGEHAKAGSAYTVVRLESLDTLNGALPYAKAWAINENGTVVGESDLQDKRSVSDMLRAVRWESGSTKPVQLNTLSLRPEDGYSAKAVDASGTAYGYGSDELGLWATRWPAGSAQVERMPVLGTNRLGGQYTQVWSVRPDGTAVGQTEDYLNNNGFLAPVIWSPGAQLPTRLLPGTGVAHDINTSGTVVGAASGVGAFRLTPGQEPETLQDGSVWAVNDSGVAVGDKQGPGSTPTSWTSVAKLWLPGHSEPLTLERRWVFPVPAEWSITPTSASCARSSAGSPGSPTSRQPTCPG